MKKEFWMEFYQRNSIFLSTAAVPLFVVLLFFLWVPSALSVLLPLCWHYVLCIPLLVLCYCLKKMGKEKMTVGIAFVIFTVAIAGFFLVYQGPFVQSGKTFHLYLTQYGLCTLPVLLCPCAAALITLKK